MPPAGLGRPRRRRCCGFKVRMTRFSHCACGVVIRHHLEAALPADLEGGAELVVEQERMGVEVPGRPHYAAREVEFNVVDSRGGPCPACSIADRTRGSRHLPGREATLRPRCPIVRARGIFLFSSPGIRFALSGKGLALAMQLHQNERGWRQNRRQRGPSSLPPSGCLLQRSLPRNLR
jgi:hypothetical protein